MNEIFELISGETKFINNFLFRNIFHKVKNMLHVETLEKLK